MNNKPSSSITQQQLESYLWGAATLLRGVIDAGDYKQFIFPLLFFKRICDVYDEEFQSSLDESEGDVTYASFAENHRLQIPEGAHWRDVRNQTNAEFYTNRTLVHLMTLMLDPQPGESIYDPTCGSGGMLLSAVAELQRQGKEYRTYEPLPAWY